MNMKDYSIRDLGQLIELLIKGKHFVDARECLAEVEARIDAAADARMYESLPFDNIPGGALSYDRKTAAKIDKVMPNEILAELPMVETKEPTLKYESNVAPVPPMPPAVLEQVAEEWVGKAVTPVPEPEPQVESPLDEGIIDHTDKPVIKVDVSLGDITEQEADSKTLAEVAQDRNEETALAVVAINEAHEVAEPEPGIIRDEDGKVTHVSVQAGNPGYDPDIHENTTLKIYCDGKYIENAHTADTVAGTVLYYKKNEQGRIKTLELYGEVEIRGLD